MDPVAATALLITQMNSLIASKVSPLDSAVLDFASVEAFNPAGDAPGRSVVKGSIRFLKDATGKTLCNAISNIAEGLEISMGIKAQCRFEEEYRTSTNAAGCVELLKRITVKKIRRKHVPIHGTPLHGQ